MAHAQHKAVEENGYQRVLHALRLYMDTDNCVCEEEGECPPNCEKCMYCIGYNALRLAGEYEQGGDEQ